MLSSMSIFIIVLLLTNIKAQHVDCDSFSENNKIYSLIFRGPTCSGSVFREYSFDYIGDCIISSSGNNVYKATRYTCASNESMVTVYYSDTACTNCMMGMLTKWEWSDGGVCRSAITSAGNNFSGYDVCKPTISSTIISPTQTPTSKSNCQPYPSNYLAMIVGISCVCFCLLIFKVCYKRSGNHKIVVTTSVEEQEDVTILELEEY